MVAHQRYCALPPESTAQFGGYPKASYGTERTRGRNAAYPTPQVARVDCRAKVLRGKRDERWKHTGPYRPPSPSPTERSWRTKGASPET